ncbi:hypothetical protein AB0O82_24290 [Kitasatospora sp. NPDC088264]|uniref:hypothetical protein n=1 Tax=Kitasatospora sp. NPDC088264 TaxID=3155296 RepID=UPI00342E4803
MRTGATHPLLGLTIDDQHSPTEAYIYLTPPDGQRELLTLALEDTPEADVRAFVVHIHSAVADTGNRRQAEQNLHQVTAQLKNDLRIPQARRELDTAYHRWQELTGHRPK